MARRLPGIRARMEDAALELYERQGLAATSAKQIAEAAGTTERTFFRHFHDKADAAFGDESRLRELVADAARAADGAPTPFDAALAGVHALAAEFEARRAVIVRRALVVAAEPALRDRELGRTSEWTDLLSDAVRAHDVPPARARVAASVALTVFRVALERWVDSSTSTLAKQLDRAAHELREVIVPPA